MDKAFGRNMKTFCKFIK